LPTLLTSGGRIGGSRNRLREHSGTDIVRRALQAPARQIFENAGEDPLDLDRPDCSRRRAPTTWRVSSPLTSKICRTPSFSRAAISNSAPFV
jgi:chaperonin GroEL (HSP60 family)